MKLLSRIPPALIVTEDMVARLNAQRDLAFPNHNLGDADKRQRRHDRLCDGAELVDRKQEAIRWSFCSTGDLRAPEHLRKWQVLYLNETRSIQAENTRAICDVASLQSSDHSDGTGRILNP